MTSPKRPRDAAIEHAAARRKAEQEILAGRLPTIDELLSGLPLLEDKLTSDIPTWSRALLAEPELVDPELRAALELLVASRTTGVIASVLEQLIRSECETSATDPELGRMLADGIWRCRFYLAAHGAGNRRELVNYLLTRSSGAYQEVHYVAFAIGLLGRSPRKGFIDPVVVLDEGCVDMRHLVELMDELDEAHRLDRADGSTPADDVAERIADVIEDRAEIVRKPDGTGLLDQLRQSALAVKVVPSKPAGLRSGRADAWRPFELIAGTRLPLRPVTDVVAAQIDLQLQWPHAAASISTILRDLGTAKTVRLRPTLLVGSPGCGKTSLARAIADALNVPSMVYSAGGIADSSLMGTSAQWSTSRPSIPLDAIRAGKVANPLIILDEIDKTSQDRRNGSLVDALLGFLEPTTSARYFDLALEAEVDLSHVNWIATANDLRGVPGPLRDRFRIVEIPDPSWEHVGDLARTILDDIARERSLDRRWIEDLAADELEILHEAWPGGSLRKLRRALEVLVDGRDQLLWRA